MSAILMRFNKIRWMKRDKIVGKIMTVFHNSNTYTAVSVVLMLVAEGMSLKCLTICSSSKIIGPSPNSRMKFCHIRWGTCRAKLSICESDFMHMTNNEIRFPVSTCLNCSVTLFGVATRLRHAQFKHWEQCFATVTFGMQCSKKFHIYLLELL